MDSGTRAGDHGRDAGRWAEGRKERRAQEIEKPLWKDRGAKAKYITTRDGLTMQENEAERKVFGLEKVKGVRR